MGLSGFVAGGAQNALNEALDRRMREQIRQQQEQQEAARLALQQRQLESQQENQRRTIDLADLRRRDDNNRQGLELMQQDKAQMDTDAILSSLNPEQRRIVDLRRVGIEPERPTAPRRHVVNGAMVDDDGNVLYQAPEKPTGPSGPKEPRWVRMGDGTVVDINGIAPPGSKPYDAVAERTSAPVNPAEAQDTAREAKRLASALLGHKGLPGAFGVVSSQFPTMRQDTADAESLRDSLTSLLTMENMGKMKGVLSDSDMKILRAASTTINPRMGDAAARAELKRVIDIMERASGEGPTGQMPTMDLATSRGGSAAPPKRMRFDAKGNPIP